MHNWRIDPLSPLAAFSAVYIAYFLAGYAQPDKLALFAYRPEVPWILLVGWVAFVLGCMGARRLHPAGDRLPEPHPSRIALWPFGLLFVLIGLVGVALILLSQGILLADEKLRLSANPKWVFLSSFFWFGILLWVVEAIQRGRAMLAVGLVYLAVVVVSLIAYRTPVAILLITVSFLLHYGLRRWRLWQIGLFALSVVVLLVGMGQLRSPEGDPVPQGIEAPASLADKLLTVATNPSVNGQVVVSRILDYIDMEGTLGGRLHLNIVTTVLPGQPGPRGIVTEVVNSVPGKVVTSEGRTTTSTIVGQFLLDFGLPGVILGMGALGWFLTWAQQLYLRRKDLLTLLFYGYAMAVSLIAIHTGLLDLIIWLLGGFTLMLIILTSAWFRGLREKKEPPLALREGGRLRIGILGNYGHHNNGDEAILSGLIQQIQEQLPEAQITVFSFDPADTAARHPQAEVVPLVVREGRERDLIASFRHIYQACKHLDLLVVGGGALLMDTFRAQLPLYTGVAWIARRAGAQVYYYAVGVGPLHTRWGRALVRASLSRAARITVRDRESRQLLEQIGVRQPVEVVADPAFGLLPVEPDPVRLRELGVPERPYVVISAMPYYHPGADSYTDLRRYRAYVEGMQQLLRQVLARTDWQLVFIGTKYPQDMHTAYDIAGGLDSRRVTLLDRELVPEDLLQVLQGSEMLIGTRLHALILGAVAGRPLLGLAYRSKVSAVFADGGRGEDIVSLEDPDWAGQAIRRLEAILPRLAEQRQRVEEMYRERHADAHRHAARLSSWVRERLFQATESQARQGRGQLAPAFLKVFGWVVLINILARLLGFVREMVLAYQFGATAETDAYLIAFTLPNFLYLVVGGALTTAIIPFLVGQVSPAERWRKVNALINTLLLGSLALFAAGELAPLWMVGLLAPGTSLETLEHSARLFQIMLPSTWFLMVASIYTGMLNAHKRFQLAAVARLAQNLVIILSIFWLSAALGIASAAWGVLVGSIAYALMQLVQLHRLGYRYRLTLWHPELREIFLFSIPVMLGGAVMQVYTILIRFFAGGLEEGSIAAMNYAMLLMQLPQSVLVGTFANLLFPGLAEDAKEGRMRELARSFVSGTRLSLLMLLPLSAFFISYAPELVGLLFGYGAFTERDVERTARLLVILSLGLPFHSLNLYWTRYFYSLRQGWGPVVASLGIVVGLNSLLSAWLRIPWGIEGIAASVTLTAILNTLVLLILIRRKLEIGGQLPSMWRAAAQITLSSAAAGVLAYGLKLGLLPLLQLPLRVERAILVLAGALAGAVLLLLLWRWMRLAEFQELRVKLLRRQGRL